MNGNNGNTAEQSRGYVTPWTLRIYDFLPGNPVSIGIGLTFGLLVIYFLGRSAFPASATSPIDEMRVAITHILQTAYAASAYAFLLMTARRTASDLADIARDTPQWQSFAGRVGRHPRWTLLLAGAAYAGLFGVAATNATTPDEINPWEWQSWSYDIYWHRGLSLFFNWWTGCLFYVIVVESTRLSRLSRSLDSVDLFDLLPYQPLIRLGLTNALLVIGVVSLASLLVVESRYAVMLIPGWVVCVLFAWIGLMLPLGGIRKKVRTAKKQELGWCQESVRKARDALKYGGGPGPSMAEIVAYRNAVENVRNWPFDNPTLVRFALYLLIPLGSWLGGAFVERGLDLFLS